MSSTQQEALGGQVTPHHPKNNTRSSRGEGGGVPMREGTHGKHRSGRLREVVCVCARTG